MLFGVDDLEGPQGVTVLGSQRASLREPAHGGETLEPQHAWHRLHVDLQRIAQGGVMPTIIVTHDVTDTDHWLSSPKREELLPSLGGQ